MADGLKFLYLRISRLWVRLLPGALDLPPRYRVILWKSPHIWGLFFFITSQKASNGAISVQFIPEQLIDLLKCLHDLTPAKQSLAACQGLAHRAGFSLPGRLPPEGYPGRLQSGSQDSRRAPFSGCQKGHQRIQKSHQRLGRDSRPNADLCRARPCLYQRLWRY
jgi:hypothetical protein